MILAMPSLNGMPDRFGEANGGSVRNEVQVSAFNVSVLIGSSNLTAFRAIAHDTAHDQYRQFLARVLGSAREGQTRLLNCAVRSARERGRHGPPR